jgi:hypothetical protein
MNFLIKGDILWQTRKKSHGQNLGLLFKNTEVLRLNLSWNLKKKHDIIMSTGCMYKSFSFAVTRCNNIFFVETYYF